MLAVVPELPVPREGRRVCFSVPDGVPHRSSPAAVLAELSLCPGFSVLPLGCCRGKGVEEMFSCLGCKLLGEELRSYCRSLMLSSVSDLR